MGLSPYLTEKVPGPSRTFLFSCLMSLLSFYGLIFRSRGFSVVYLLSVLYLVPCLLYFVLLSFGIGLGGFLGLGFELGLGLGAWVRRLCLGLDIVACLFLPPPTKSTKPVWKGISEILS